MNITNPTADQKRILTNAVVTDAAVRRSRWSEDFAGVAVLELDDLVIDLNVAYSRRGSLPCWDIPIGGLCANIHTHTQNFSENSQASQ